MIPPRRALLAGVLALALPACRGTRGPLPEGATLGAYASKGAVESYSAATLYGYMDGGAEIFREYGVSRAWVGRYTRGSRELVVELYEMKDAVSAAALYTYMRPAGSETDLVGGCRGSLAGSDARLAKGRHYLVCRDEDPMAQSSDAVRDLCSRVAARLDGACGAADLFRALPAEGRVAGSEIQLAGPLGLNLRPWLAPLGSEGFRRGWIATFTLPGGKAEALFGEYASQDLARRALAGLAAAPRPGVVHAAGDRSIAVVAGLPAQEAELQGLARRLLAPAAAAR